MTRKEAIELLTYMMVSYDPKDQYGDYDDPKPYEQAIDMAIESLSAVPSGDLISRDDAINRLNEIHKEVEEVYVDDFDRGTMHGLAWAIDILKGLPSIDTMSIEEHQQIVTELKQSYTRDRPKGEWVRIWASEYETCPLSRCSNCNEEYPSIADNYNYCPHCGADMRGEK